MNKQSGKIERLERELSLLLSNGPSTTASQSESDADLVKKLSAERHTRLCQTRAHTLDQWRQACDRETGEVGGKLVFDSYQDLEDAFKNEVE